MKSVWVMMLLLHCALSEKFEVVAPVSPVVATFGSDVVLLCSVQRLPDRSSLSAVDMNITWTRPDLGGALVHFYENHKDVNTKQILHYKGRTALFTEDLQNGNVSLRLSDVDLRDEGDYKCQVDSEFWNDDVSLNLNVEVIGERPVISVESYDETSEQFSLLCESKGWRPQPDLQWLNSKRENQPAGVLETQRHAELFTVKRRFTVHKNHINMFYCRATLGEHTKEEEEIKPGVFYVIGERPVISVESYDSNSEQFTLLCQSKGWRPQPDLQLLNSKGENQPAGVPEIQRHAELFTVKRRFTVRKNHIDTFYCRATLGRQTKKEEIKAGVLYDLLPMSTGAKVGIGIAVILVIVAGIAICIYKGRKEKEELKKVILALMKPEEEQRDDSAVAMNLLNPEEEQRNDSSVETGFLNCLRMPSLQKLRKFLQGILEFRSTVQLCGKGLTEKSCAVLASALSSPNSTLTELDLSENSLKDSGVKKLCEGLKSSNCKLQKLRLINCSFTKECCASLASLLSLKSSTLRELDLSQNDLWDSGVEELSKGLKSQDCKLERLGI